METNETQLIDPYGKNVEVATPIIAQRRLEKVLEWLDTVPEREIPKLIQDTFNIKQAASYNLLKKARNLLVEEFMQKSKGSHIVDTMKQLDDLIKTGSDTIKCRAIKLKMELLNLQNSASVSVIVNPNQDEIINTPVDDVLGNQKYRTRLIEEDHGQANNTTE